MKNVFFHCETVICLSIRWDCLQMGEPSKWANPQIGWNPVVLLLDSSTKGCFEQRQHLLCSCSLVLVLCGVGVKATNQQTAMQQKALGDMKPFTKNEMTLCCPSATKSLLQNLTPLPPTSSQAIEVLSDDDAHEASDHASAEHRSVFGQPSALFRRPTSNRGPPFWTVLMGPKGNHLL